MHKVPNHSFSGFRYWVTFIDNYGRYCFVLPIQAKSDVFNAFQQFKVFAENQMERKIKTLRDGKGGEYMSNVMLEFTNECGIEHQHTLQATTFDKLLAVIFVCKIQANSLFYMGTSRASTSFLPPVRNMNI
jgi:hypothetical protein